MHAKYIDLGAHCVPRGYMYLGVCYVQDMRKKIGKKEKTRSLRNGKCRNADEHAVERIKTIVMQLRGRFSLYRLE